ncbi:MAG: translation initiation factor Sui1 [Nitrospiria bacterium]
MRKTPRQKNSGLVYSTALGKMCPACGKPEAGCSCRKQQIPPASDGIVRIRRETKRRKGKGVTVITDLPLNPDALKQFGKTLKSQCGTGGTVKNGMIEIQGDHQDKLAEILRKEGWTVKRSGG